MKLMFFLVALMLLSSVSAFTYGGDLYLTFEGKAKETICREWNIQTDQNMTISNKWSKNLSRWSSGDMTKTAAQAHIQIFHPKNYFVSPYMQKLTVCVKANNPKEYRGMLFLDYKQKGNQKIRMGIWLKAKIT